MNRGGRGGIVESRSERHKRIRSLCGLEGGLEMERFGGGCVTLIVICVKSSGLPITVRDRRRFSTKDFLQY